GIADIAEWGPESVTIRVLDIHEWVRSRLVAGQRLFRCCSAGIIVRVALRDAFVGLGSVPITVGAIVDAPPLIDQYQFDRQPLESVLSDLQEQTGQVWRIDARTLRFDWQMSAGKYHDSVLVDNGTLIDNIQLGTLREQNREVIERDRRTGRTFSAF